MKRVLTTNFSKYSDPRTNAQFDPVLNHQTGCFVGVALVDDETAEEYEDREGFEVLTDQEFLEISTPPGITGSPAPTPPAAPGDDAKAKASGPPPSPSDVGKSVFAEAAQTLAPLSLEDLRAKARGEYEISDPSQMDKPTLIAAIVGKQGYTISETTEEQAAIVALADTAAAPVSNGKKSPAAPGSEGS